jgi:Fe2+ transport system protein FeoA
LKKESISLAALPEGHSATIAALEENAYTCKLLTLGLLPNARVTMVRKSPFGDAFYVKMQGYQLAVRKDEAMTIKIMTEQV